MPRINFNDGQEIVYSDLNNAQAAVLKDVFDRALFQVMNGQSNFIFGAGFLVARVNATTVSVAAGTGFQTQSESDPEPTLRLLYAANSLGNSTVAAADGTNSRIDIISIKAATAVSATDTRNFKDANTLSVSQVSMTTETDWSPLILVTTGTPAGSPVAPATPAGYIKLAEITVHAITGIVSSADIVDKRPRYQRASSNVAVTSQSSTYSMDQDDEIILCTNTFTVTLTSAALLTGKRVTIKNNGTGVITIARAGSDTIDGATSLTLPTQYDSVTLVADGSTAWNVI